MRRSPKPFLSPLILVALLALLSGCATKENTIIDVIEPAPLFDGLSFGTPETLEIMTWNLYNFPDGNSLTRIEYLSAALGKLQVDIVGMQEIKSASSFAQVVSRLPGYEGYRADSAYMDLDLAFIWNTATVDVDTIYEIFTHDSGPFPRPPLVMECTWSGVSLIVIVNHLKAMGTADDVDRRREACILLDGYISANHPDDRVVVMGDMNDLLIDTGTNVFQVFLDEPADYRFADYEIAQDPRLSWSWRLESHLDHILITDELFPDFGAEGSEVRTLRMDRYLTGGFGEYVLYLSDHLPVALKLDIAPAVR